MSSECPGGACVAGRCLPLVGADLGSAGDQSPAGDLALPSGADAAGDAVAPLCTWNGDGVIERSEAPFIVGLGALFAVNASGSNTTVDLAQKAGVWDFTAAVPGEHKVFDQLLSAGGHWWTPDFASATHAEKLDDGQGLYGVYQATDGALRLLGVVSDANGAQKTELTYATPIDVLRFPLKQGDTWTQTSTVTGFAQGVYIAATDSYAITVDARGTTKAPGITLDTLRLRIDYKQVLGFLTTTRITYLHLAECYGALARIRSQDNEMNPGFTTAVEYRRFAIQ